MLAYISNNIRLSKFPLPLKLKIIDDLTIDNPAFLKAKYQRRPTWGIDQKLRLYIYDNDGSLVLPRGYEKCLVEHIHALKIPTRTETVQVEGKPTDFGPWNDAYEIREYQKPLVEALVAENGIGWRPPVPVKRLWVCGLFMR